MAFSINNVEAEIIILLKDGLSIQQLYQELNGGLSLQYTFQLVRNLKLKGTLDRIKIDNKRVKYKANEGGLKLAKEKLSLKFHTD